LLLRGSGRAREKKNRNKKNMPQTQPINPPETPV
jgi:hypothetical protein